MLPGRAQEPVPSAEREPAQVREQEPGRVQEPVPSAEREPAQVREPVRVPAGGTG